VKEFPMPAERLLLIVILVCLAVLLVLAVLNAVS
jgi:hypothetical protein